MKNTILSVLVFAALSTSCTTKLYVCLYKPDTPNCWKSMFDTTSKKEAKRYGEIVWTYKLKDIRDTWTIQPLDTMPCPDDYPYTWEELIEYQQSKEPKY